MINVEAILVGLLSVSHTPEQAEHAAREVLSIHAKQLAEKQRAWADSFGATPAQQAVASIVREAAALIAPEAA
ncbi:hypothetical protein ACFV0B_11565 [Streptomyces xanthophaeus]|uniref:hypothetical protein n=1 Tax=Streptomyces xanthophaeus TaxID=67385 RepID=UPI0036B40D98